MYLLSLLFISVTYGVNSKEQRSIVRTFLQNIYQVNIDQIVTAVMNEYTDYRHTGENKMTNRDTLLDIFSDARVAAPVLKAASLHAEAKEANQAYLYVFKHVTKKGYYSEVSSTETLETIETVWFLFLLKIQILTGKDDRVELRVENFLNFFLLTGSIVRLSTF